MELENMLKAWDKEKKQMCDIAFIDFEKPQVGLHCLGYGSYCQNPEDVKFIRNTYINDVDGDPIYEDMRVHQKSVLVGSPDIDFTGYVKMLDGTWCIDNGKEAISLFNECCETTIIEEF